MTFTSWPTEKNTVVTVFNIFTMMKCIDSSCYFIVLRVIWEDLKEIMPWYASANTEISEVINHILLTEYPQGVNGF